MTKKQLCDWADELQFAEVFEALDNVPNKPESTIHLYNDLKVRYVANESNRQFVGQLKTYIRTLNIPEKPETITPQEMGIASYQLAELLKQEGEISPDKAKEIFEAVNKMMEKMNHDINKKINPQTKAEVFFERIISENKLNQTDTNDIRILLKANALPYAYQCILVSALMLSLVRKYDKTRTDLLIDALNENVPHVWERALLALVLGLSGREERVKADTTIVRRLQALQTQEAVQKALVSISQALYQIQIEKVIENNEFITTFSKFRKLGFFAKENKPHYWFMPFYAENTELLDFFEESNSNLNHKYLIELLASPYEFALSDSNKYALCFATSIMSVEQNYSTR